MGYIPLQSKMDKQSLKSINRLFYSSVTFLALAICFFIVSCAQVTTIDDLKVCTFAVVDVGQGLSQICATHETALVFDVGDSGASNSWQKTYDALGSPRVGAIVVSHTHIDHMGGLSKLPASMSFSGQIITHPGEDTAYIRWKMIEERRKDVYFTFVAQGDTISGLDGVHVECIWPPRQIDGSDTIVDSLKNHYSLCFLVRCGATTALITSDIDTTTERELSLKYQYGLKSDLMVAPHHGSASSVDPVFYGYVNPSAVIIPCGKGNPYGFPSGTLMNLVYQMRLEVHRTDKDGSVIAYSDGYYWQWR
jgi:competence protein ComEC